MRKEVGPGLEGVDDDPHYVHDEPCARYAETSGLRCCTHWYNVAEMSEGWRSRNCDCCRWVGEHDLCRYDSYRPMGKAIVG